MTAGAYPPCHLTAKAIEAERTVKDQVVFWSASLNFTKDLLLV